MTEPVKPKVNFMASAEWEGHLQGFLLALNRWTAVRDEVFCARVADIQGNLFISRPFTDDMRQRLADADNAFGAALRNFIRWEISGS